MSTASFTPALIRFHNSQTIVYRDGKGLCVRTWSDVVLACRLLDVSGERNNQIKDVLEYLDQWLHKDSTGIERAYLGVKSDRLIFIVVQPEYGFDAALADRLCDLEIELANTDRFNMLDFSAMALPKCSELDVSQFFGVDNLDVTEGVNA